MELNVREVKVRLLSATRTVRMVYEQEEECFSQTVTCLVVTLHSGPWTVQAIDESESLLPI